MLPNKREDIAAECFLAEAERSVILSVKPSINPKQASAKPTNRVHFRFLLNSDNMAPMKVSTSGPKS
jgi:hypothetical protein